MGYKKMSDVDVYEIFRRYHSGQTISEISGMEKHDRKTIRGYIQKLNDLGFTKEKPLPEREGGLNNLMQHSQLEVTIRKRRENCEKRLLSAIRYRRKGRNKSGTCIWLNGPGDSAAINPLTGYYKP